MARDSDYECPGWTTAQTKPMPCVSTCLMCSVVFVAFLGACTYQTFLLSGICRVYSCPEGALNISCRPEAARSVPQGHCQVSQRELCNEQQRQILALFEQDSAVI